MERALCVSVLFEVRCYGSAELHDIKKESGVPKRKRRWNMEEVKVLGFMKARSRGRGEKGARL